MLSVTLALAVAVAVAPPVQLERLARLYLAYELPLPPKDAKLYRYDSTKSVRPDGPPRIGFAARLKPDGSPDALLVGCAEESAYHKFTTELPPDAKVIAAAEVRLPTAVQMYLRGWRELAAAVFVPGDDPERTLALYAVSYWRDQLHRPTTDRAKVARRLGVIRRAEPTAFTKDSEEFYDHLLLSLKPSKAKPGSVEADIDELLDVSSVLSGGWCGDDRYAAVVARGFDAVPSLLDHLSDSRLTRSQSCGFVPRWTCFHDYRVKHFASDILVGLLHDGEAKTPADGVVRAKDARAWWAEAQKSGEEAFAVARVLKAKGDPNRPNLHLLVVLERKYPQRLPEVFRTLLADHPTMGLEEMAAAVAESSLPGETKRELFTSAAESKKEEWQQVGRERLRELDEKK